MRRFAVALIHYPVLDRQGATVTTAITNLDLHDIARSSHCFGAEAFFAVHPITAQRELAERVRTHWTVGSGAKRIPDRSPALGGLRVVPSLEEAEREFFQGEVGECWTTSASSRGPAVSLGEARALMQSDGPPVLLLFGTGWGLAASALARASVHLAPIRSPRSDGYNHLSVRAAVAILLDRLCGVA